MRKRVQDNTARTPQRYTLY